MKRTLSFIFILAFLFILVVPVSGEVLHEHDYILTLSDSGDEIQASYLCSCGEVLSYTFIFAVVFSDGTTDVITPTFGKWIYTDTEFEILYVLDENSNEILKIYTKQQYLDEGDVENAEKNKPSEDNNIYLLIGLSGLIFLTLLFISLSLVKYKKITSSKEDEKKKRKTIK